MNLANTKNRFFALTIIYVGEGCEVGTKARGKNMKIPPGRRH